MITQQLQQAVGRFSSRQDAEAALNRLVEKGFNTEKISILTKDEEAAKTIADATIKQAKEESPIGGAMAGAITGVGTGFFTGGLLGALSVKIFAEGPVDNVGTVFTYALLGAAIGIVGCALIGALMGSLLGRKPAKSDKSSVDQNNDYIVVVEGSQDNIQQAQSILRNWGK